MCGVLRAKLTLIKRAALALEQYHSMRDLDGTGKVMTGVAISLSTRRNGSTSACTAFPEY